MGCTLGSSALTSPLQRWYTAKSVLATIVKRQEVHGTLRVTAIACAALVCALCACTPRRPVAAKVTSTSGDVSRQVDEKRNPVAPGAALYEGDVVATGADSSVAVGFEGGGIVSLGANSALVIRRAGATATQLGAVLMQGSARATGKAHGVRFSIGTPFGFAVLGGGDDDTEISVSTHDGLKVLLGAIEVIGADGRRTKLDINTLMDANGRVQSANQVVNLAPLDIVLLAKSSEVQIRPKGETDWHAATKRDPLKPGDAIRTMHAKGTHIDVGEHAGVTLQSDSELSVLEPTREAKIDRARYELTSGDAVFDSTRTGERTSVHEVHLGNQQLTVEPGVAAANVEMATGPNGRSEVAVRQGRVTLANGTIVEPGNLLSISSEGATSVRPLAATNIDLHAGSSAVVYFSGEVPPLKLTWEGAAGPPFEVQVANDRNFKEIVWHEMLSQPGVVTDQFRPGRYFWRVRTSTGWREANFSIERSRQTNCRTCKHSNVIDDTGEKTVVYFQKILPVITLRWVAVANASKYHVKVFAAGALDKPIVDETQNATTIVLPAGRLPEADYFWLAQALGADGKEVAPGRINGLNITYDNAVAELEVRAPAHNAIINNDSVVTTGDARLGSRVWVNGRPAPLDGKGRFRESLALSKGDNQIVYRTLGNSGIERYYVRRVHRR